ncbi:hypothetical protein [Nitrosophilus labii]|uniref:hypothetical protein n=1 Tax=Nitrosophilus labii TaxID=2706014 RepID=UPI001657515C|nr:hypothetical protein [Nitrosophilus labii]
MKVMNASGRLIDPFNLQPEDFDPRIIAQTLSRVCRFWSQTSEFYSVAQHCLVMESLFDDIELKKWALGHEIFEGLTGMDIPSPIKHSPAMESYRRAEERALEQLADIYGLPKPMPKAIKLYDKRLMVTEALRFMNTVNFDWTQIADPLPLKVIGKPLSMAEAQQQFLVRWYELFEM